MENTPRKKVVSIDEIGVFSIIIVKGANMKQLYEGSLVRGLTVEKALSAVAGSAISAFLKFNLSDVVELDTRTLSNNAESLDSVLQGLIKRIKKETRDGRD